MITRRSVLLAGGIGLLFAQRLSHGQPAATIRRVGWLSLASETTSALLYASFNQGMQDLGWLEGKNVEYRIAYADGDVNRLDALASELIGQKVEVIVAGSSAVTHAAQRATKAIPIVMVGVSNAVGNGFVASLAKPGGNITGVSNQREEVLGKLIGILHEVMPGARRIAILLNDSNSSYDWNWAAAQSACAALDLVALRVVASVPAQLGAAVEQIVRQQSQAVAVSSDAMYFSERAKLQELMQTTRLPVAYELRDQVLAGGHSAPRYPTGAAATLLPPWQRSVTAAGRAPRSATVAVTRWSPRSAASTRTSRRFARSSTGRPAACTSARAA